MSIASLRTLHARRQTLYEHQAWARAYLDLQDVDAAGVGQLQEVLDVASLEAAHSDELAETARMWLYELRIVIPRPRRLADWAREGIAGLQRRLITSGQRPTGASSRKHRNVGPEAGCCPSTFNVHAFGGEPLPFCMATPRPMHV